MSKGNTDLLKDKEGTLLAKYILPSVGGMLGLSMCILFDTMFIGKRLGAMGIAALNITLPIYSLMSAIGLTFGVGGATLLSIYLGKKKFESVNKIFTTSIVGIGIIYILFLLVRFLFIDKLIYALGASGATFDMVKSYIDVLLIFSGAYMGLNALNVFIRNDGNPKLAMMAVIVTNIVNIILDYVFMFPMGMGIDGAALATSIGQFAGIGVLMLHFTKGRSSFKFDMNMFDFRFLNRIIRTGIPSFISGLTAGIVIMLFNIVSFNLMGNAGLSAYGVVNNIALIFVAVFNGVAQGIQPLISINYGAGNYARVQKFINLGRIIMFGTGTVFFIIGIMFPIQLIEIFTTGNTQFMAVAREGIIIYFASFILAGVNILNIAALQSVEKVKISTLLSILRGFVYIIICLALFSKSYGMTGLWLTIPSVEFATITTLYIIDSIKKRKIRKKVRNNPNRIFV